MGRVEPKQVLIYEKKGDYVNDAMIRTAALVTIAVVLVIALIWGFDLTN